jgi:hypothetical protein
VNELIRQHRELNITIMENMGGGANLMFEGRFFLTVFSLGWVWVKDLGGNMGEIKKIKG